MLYINLTPPRPKEKKQSNLNPPLGITTNNINNLSRHWHWPLKSPHHMEPQLHKSQHGCISFIPWLLTLGPPGTAPNLSLSKLNGVACTNVPDSWDHFSATNLGRFPLNDGNCIISNHIIKSCITCWFIVVWNQVQLGFHYELMFVTLMYLSSYLRLAPPCLANLMGEMQGLWTLCWTDRILIAHNSLHWHFWEKNSKHIEGFATMRFASASSCDVAFCSSTSWQPHQLPLFKSIGRPEVINTWKLNWLVSTISMPLKLDHLPISGKICENQNSKHWWSYELQLEIQSHRNKSVGIPYLHVPPVNRMFCAGGFAIHGDSKLRTVSRCHALKSKITSKLHKESNLLILISQQITAYIAWYISKWRHQHILW